MAFTFAIGMAATPASATDVPRVTNGNSGLCLEISGESTANGARATQWGCTGSAHQSWYFKQEFPSFRWRLINNNSGKCLEIADWRTDDGAPARQWDCTGGDNQLWYAIDYPDDGTGAMALVNIHSGKCLEIGGWSTAWGAGASQWSCHKGANQLWNGVPSW
ncbi:ricin-type beta-trefoil lectin protein [Streptomyces sp. 3211.6]|uniref:RICIN domain-containing protein n=1 Tax=Streptomyces TaxID=1883 RepID=UPI000CB900B7|nr:MULTISPECIES: RICIN domain-containing protein [Streptomyces]RKT08623.1 ricin-type beta-trefoil lectin protein [Streptomyces sp. 3211.6]RPF30021.1 ricin-type beta-trefoil lectin protein [Streptomyces sp. Ag109_G2-6]